MTDKELVDALRGITSRSKEDLLQEAANRIKALSAKLACATSKTGVLWANGLALETQLEQALKDLRDGPQLPCVTCANRVEGPCPNAEDCCDCKDPCACWSCNDNSNWVWRGIVEEPT